MKGQAVEVNREKCVCCGYCKSLCAQHALDWDNEGLMHADPMLCISCYICVDGCPREAISK